MKKIIDYSTFKKVYMTEPGADEEETASENSDSDDDDSDTESDDETTSESDADENGDLRNFIVPDISLEETEDEDEDGDDPIEDDDADILPKKKSKSKTKKKAEKRRQKIKGKRKEIKETVTIAKLKKEATRSKKGRAQYMRYLKKHWQPSAKVTKCVELLERFQTEKRKTIIFSQFVSLLDLLQVPIDDKGWKCERYDGSMNAEQRNDAIMRFTDKPNHNIMLISLKAGNAGLNLVAASRVIILDPFWNPYIEMQAIDRAYRIGQQNSIEVHRILIEKTVEDRIIELQETKKRLINAALDEGAGKTVSRLGERELAFLFGVGA
jgi:SNF2 family DNA or RNA helicase